MSMLSPAVRKKHPFQKMCKTSLEICHRSSARQQLETWRALAPVSKALQDRAAVMF